MAQMQDEPCEILATWLGCGCCIREEEYKKDPLPEIVQNKYRHCTDIPYFVILLAVFISQIFLISYASSKGSNPEWLFHGHDYQGYYCDSNNKNGSYTAWPDLDSTYSVRICVHDCSQTLSDSRMVQFYDSESFLKAYCIPKDDSYDVFGESNEILDHAIGDLNTAKWLIFASTFIAIFIAFLYVNFVSCIGQCLLWLTLLATFVGGFMLSYMLILNGAEDMGETTQKTQGKAELAFGIILCIFMIILFLALFWMRTRIRLAFSILDEASNAILDMKTTLFWPVIASIFAILYMALWLAVALYIYSVSETTTKPMPNDALIDTLHSDTYVALDFNDDMQRALIYHFVTLLFMMQVIIYFSFMVLAGVMADWYFSTWSDSKQKHKIRGMNQAELAKSPIIEALWRVIRYHMGTLAFGALIMVPFRIARMIVQYIEYKTKNSNNRLAKCVLACADCCLNCCGKCINFINKEAYIFTTIYGSPFCYSAITSFKLIETNLGRAFAVEAISTYMEIFGRVGIAVFTTGICAIVLKYNNYYQNNIYSILFPCLIIFLISYLIAALFMVVFEVAVDTLFLCFLIDENVHGEPRFASKRLQEVINIGTVNHNQKEKLLDKNSNSISYNKV